MKPEIPRKQYGWKKRRLENAIISIVNSATTPQSAYAIEGKIRKGRRFNFGATYPQIWPLMIELEKEGLIKNVGQDSDLGFLYKSSEA